MDLIGGHRSSNLKRCQMMQACHNPCPTTLLADCRHPLQIIPLHQVCFYSCIHTILGISLHFSFFAKNEESFKNFATKAKKLRKNKNDNSNCFYAQIKGFHHKYQFSVVDRNHSRSKNPVWYIFFNFYCRFM